MLLITACLHEPSIDEVSANLRIGSILDSKYIYCGEQKLETFLYDPSTNQSIEKLNTWMSYINKSRSKIRFGRVLQRYEDLKLDRLKYEKHFFGIPLFEKNSVKRVHRYQVKAEKDYFKFNDFEKLKKLDIDFFKSHLKCVNTDYKEFDVFECSTFIVAPNSNSFLTGQYSSFIFAKEKLIYRKINESRFMDRKNVAPGDNVKLTQISRVGSMTTELVASFDIKNKKYYIFRVYHDYFLAEKSEDGSWDHRSIDKTCPDLGIPYTEQDIFKIYYFDQSERVDLFKEDPLYEKAYE